MENQQAAVPAILRAEKFDNEPHSDFSRKEIREDFATALSHVEARLGEEFSLVIDGKSVDTRKQIVSLNPSNKKQVVGRVASASADQAEQAIEAARRAYRQWSRTAPSQRAEYLELVAAEMRNRRFELAGWMVYECGKPWAEADADVAEAIDFCMFYAQQMRDLSIPVQNDFPGEENTYTYRSRGVAVVIAPWNFPLAILTGMTAAALVAGNPVVMKPAEQSSVVAAQLMSLFREVGLPDGVVQYLPGVGEEVGPALVASPDVDVIAFTGSRAVGLSINSLAAEHPSHFGVKQVITEMGGKNAIIVDADADLDEAVLGVISSAFGYAGQKCSACSRVIVLRSCYEPFLERLAEAARSITVGPASEPGVTLGPLIDEESQERVRDYIATAKEEHREVLAVDLGELESQGFFVGPHIYADVDPESRLAQNEVFGPVVAAIPARNLDEAFSIANATDYALTAGMFSRSPRNLERARNELVAGNIYLNRGITGALVNRQPFGGFRYSGIGSKAGGRDYLLQFLIPITVTENTLRRGFAPPPDDSTE